MGSARLAFAVYLTRVSRDNSREEIPCLVIPRDGKAALASGGRLVACYVKRLIKDV